MKQTGKRRATPARKRTKEMSRQPQIVDSNINELEWLDEAVTGKRTKTRARKPK